MTISASDQIAPGTTILAIGNGTITLSQPSPGNGGTNPNFGSPMHWVFRPVTVET